MKDIGPPPPQTHTKNIQKRERTIARCSRYKRAITGGNGGNCRQFHLKYVIRHVAEILFHYKLFKITSFTTLVYFFLIPLISIEHGKNMMTLFQQNARIFPVTPEYHLHFVVSHDLPLTSPRLKRMLTFLSLSWLCAISKHSSALGKSCGTPASPW